MILSQNGWPVHTVRTKYVTGTEGTWRYYCASADVAVVAHELIHRFDATVEKINVGDVRDDWSIAVRNIRGGSTSVSNHASCTAWDVNALKHPRGVHGTFTPAQIKAVRVILASIVDDDGEQVLRWGNDYVRSPIDSMHFEIHANQRRVTQAARRILGYDKHKSGSA